MVIKISQPQDMFGLLPKRRDSDSFSPGRSTAILESSSWTAEGSGVAPQDLTAWYRQFSPYENLADNKDIANRALHFVREHKRQYDDKTSQLQDKWRTAWSLYQGRTASGYHRVTKTPVHVPEAPHRWEGRRGDVVGRQFERQRVAVSKDDGKFSSNATRTSVSSYATVSYGHSAVLA